MFYGSLAFIFEVMVYVGLGLPLVNLVLGLLGGLGGGSDANLDGDLSPEMEFSGEADIDFSPDFDGELSAEDIPGTDISPSGSGKWGWTVRFNLYCLCIAMVIMGAIGVYAIETQEGLRQTLTLLFGFVLAVTGYVLFYRFLILPLKRNDASALRHQNLRYKPATVTFRILRDSPGKIQTRDAVGAVITYRAELDPDICKVDFIEEASQVMITDINEAEGHCYVTLR